ncbi:PC4-domain-containing protein [Pholiota conissans]|uniref:PC4-domain-containing protein n=1 Tax=Pholiota conissans TaxID=109636 RepID=A0A9P6CQX8_9AGAR|nr:PC4-domain-containing protein [Pholiota conissans]
MPKRKSPASSEDEASHSDGSDAPIAESKSKAKYAQKDGANCSSHDGIKILTNTDGEKYIDLGKKRRAIVRSFKKIPLLDIREYYEVDGDERPGKKGIALTLDQWKLLKGGSNAIDKLFSDLNNK